MGQKLNKQSRRNWLKTSGAVVSGVGLQTTLASAKGREWVVYKQSVSDSRLTTQSFDGSDSYSDTYTGLYTGSLGAAVRASDWVTTSTTPTVYIRDVKTCSTSAVEDDDGSGEVTRTQQTTNWEESQPSDAVIADNDNNYIGGFDGGNYESDVDGITEVIADTSIDILVSTAVALASSYSGAGIVASIIYALLSSANEDSNSYNRVWDWNRTRQTSYWTRYRINLPAGETLNFDQAERVDMYLTTDSMFSGFATTFEAPSSSSSVELNQSFSTLSDAEYSKKAALKRKGGRTYAFSGWYAKNNPDEFPLTDSELGSLRDDSVVTRTPSKFVTRPTRQDPSDLI